MLPRRLILLLAASVALVLGGVAVAAGSDPQVAVDPTDQAWAESIALSPLDLGKGWTGTMATAEGSSGSDDGASFCPEADPDQSDLVATGGTGSDFTRGPSSVTSYVIVWQTQEQAQANFDRTVSVMPALQTCTASLLNASFSGIRMTVKASGPLQFPAVATRTSAYRIKITITSAGRTKKKRKPTVLTYDTIVLGNGRALTWLVVMSSSTRPVSFAKETSLASKLAARMEQDPAATS
jgi:hypothetical protein